MERILIWESANRSKIDIKRKKYHILTRKKMYFSTHPQLTLIHLSHCFTSASKPATLKSVVSATSAPPFQGHRKQRNVCHSVMKRFMRQTLPTENMKYFFINILSIVSFSPQKIAQQNAALRQYTPQAWSPLWLLKPASEQASARLLPRLSWSWTVLLPNDTHRKPITSITSVLLPFVTYLLTLHRITIYHPILYINISVLTYSYERRYHGAAWGTVTRPPVKRDPFLPSDSPNI
jgi:hypothetical protein